MKRMTISMLAGLVLGLTGLGCAMTVQAQPGPDAPRWKTHDMDRPKPPKVTPAPQDLPVPPPENAVVLFDGQDLSQWTSGQGGEAPWTVENGYFEVAPGTGGIRTREGFGDVQLHVEWMAPDPPRGSGQNRGNSGVFLMDRYEVQVLDSYNADTYADGQAGAIYGQYPPRFNATRAPGEWQAYDIYFRRPRFDDDGTLVEPARMTVVHNGILIQDNQELWGTTSWLEYLPYETHEEALPIELQDHGSPVRFRNIWAVPLPELSAPDASDADQPADLSDAELDRLTGAYGEGSTPFVTITREGDQLFATLRWRPGPLPLVPVAENELVLQNTAGRFVFDLDDQGQPTGLIFHLGGDETPAPKQ